MIKLGIVLTVVAGVAIMGALSGCSFGMVTNYHYDNSDKYTAGDREISDKIDSIDLDYTTGDVNLIESDSDKIVITETARKELEDNQKVHTWVDGTTLRVRFCASAKGINMTGLDKKLTIAIPAGVQLSEIKLDVTTGDINATCNAEKINIDDTTGNISVTAAGVKELSAKTTTGDSSYTLAQVPASTSLKSTSGNIKIYLPKEADLTADLKVTTGEVTYEQAFSKSGNTYVCGNGANQLSAKTTTGDVILKALN